MSLPDCEPVLDVKVVNKLVSDLNETEDMLDLVHGMRRAFVKALEDEQAGVYQSPPSKKF